MIYVIATTHMKPEGREAFIAGHKECIAETLKEKGCLSYEGHISIHDPNVYVVVERWETRDDLNSHARDFKTPELRKYLDLYVRGSGGVPAVERVKLMKLLWDAVGSEFGARHELYEVNYSGSHEEIRRYALFGAIASGGNSANQNVVLAGVTVQKNIECRQERHKNGDAFSPAEILHCTT